jgi:putative tricarboxylic transport membrane protein
MGIDVVFYNWRGLFAPGSTSKETLRQLISAISTAVTSKQWAEQLSRYGWQPLFLPGEEFSSYLATQEAELESVLIQLGLVR